MAKRGGPDFEDADNRSQGRRKCVLLDFMNGLFISAATLVWCLWRITSVILYSTGAEIVSQIQQSAFFQRSCRIALFLSVTKLNEVDTGRLVDIILAGRP